MTDFAPKKNYEDTQNIRWLQNISRTEVERCICDIADNFIFVVTLSFRRARRPRCAPMSAREFFRARAVLLQRFCTLRMKPPLGARHPRGCMHSWGFRRTNSRSQQEKCIFGRWNCREPHSPMGPEGGNFKLGKHRYQVLLAKILASKTVSFRMQIFSNMQISTVPYSYQWNLHKQYRTTASSLRIYHLRITWNSGGTQSKPSRYENCNNFIQRQAYSHLHVWKARKAFKGTPTSNATIEVSWQHMKEIKKF